MEIIDAVMRLIGFRIDEMRHKGEFYAAVRFPSRQRSKVVRLASPGENARST